MNPKISVIMPAYNASRFLDESIRSILNQTFKDFEFIIIDDCSTDDTPLIIKKYMAQDARIIYRRNEKHIDQLLGRNMAFGYARGEYVAMLDADDIALPGRLETQYDYLCRHPDIALVGGWAEIIDERGLVTGHKNPEENFELLKYRLLLRNPMFHSAMFFRKDAIVKIGGYDPEYLYAEDYRLYYSLMKNDYRIGNVPEPVIKYRVHSQQVTTVPRSRQIQLVSASKTHHDMINHYMPVPLEKVKVSIETVHKIRSDLFSVLSAINFCRNLTTSYVKKEQPDTETRKAIWNIYTKEKEMLLGQVFRVHLSRLYSTAKRVYWLFPRT
jgi:glycosyltransferase involved in cell wall biosynthesis